MNRRTSTLRRAGRGALLSARLVAGGVAIARIAKAAAVVAPVRPTHAPHESIAVVIPARDEAQRIGPVLRAIVGAPGVDEVIVVDDQSTDATAAIARRAGATVVDGRPLAEGWAGKAWALQQGAEAASATWVVTLDADTRPDPLLPTSVVARAVVDRCDLLTVGGRFECPTPASRWLHAAMLTTLVYRFGPPGTSTTDPERTMANGQCMAFERIGFLGSGGMVPVRGAVVEDLALARHVARSGGHVEFLDAGEILTVRMFESLPDVWSGWSRSLALPGVETRRQQLLDLAVIVLAQVLPIPRLLARRNDVLDIVLATMRIGTLVGTRRAYTRTGVGYWLSPLADPLAAVAIARGIARRGRQTWRGRSYG